MGKIAESLIYSIHRGRGLDSSALIIDDSRVKEHAEVLTPSNIVSDMLDLVSEQYQEQNGIETGTLPIDKTFLEPSCGTGNFLVQILERKLRLCESQEDIFKAVSTIYGVDIQKDNVLESRLRMLEIVEDKCDDAKFLSLIADVLEKNIIGGDMIADKYGCSVDGNWIGGSVRNKTGTIEENQISKSHGRLVVYTWDWNEGSPTCKLEFLVEKEEEEKSVAKVEVKSQADLMSYFRKGFSKG